jgi:hypothetical protein
MHKNLRILSLEESDEWIAILQSFAISDVYYYPGYVSGYNMSGEGIPYLIYYVGDHGMRLAYVVQQLDISQSRAFPGLQSGKYYDWTTPYGYGGPLVEGRNQRDMREFFVALGEYCQDCQIVSQFIRFHPLLGNHVYFQEFSEIRIEKQTVAVDLKNHDEIWENLDSKNRNMVRKAQKLGIEIILDEDFKNIDDFCSLYQETMVRNQAHDFFYFPKDYFLNLKKHLGSLIVLFHAMYQGRIIASTMIMRSERYLHYYLSGADHAFMKMAPNNLMLVSIADWGSEQGMVSFHLGGGVMSDDSLFAFKKSFNRNGVLDFHIGANIFCKDAYTYLLEYRKNADPSFNPGKRLIQYRKGE